MNAALNHFKKHDEILFSASKNIKLNKVEKPESYFVDLVESIINQQLSAKAGATIYSRFENLFPNKKITPKKLLKFTDEEIRSVGISFSKIKYIKGIAGLIEDKKLDLKNLEKLSDEDVIEELTKIKGIGTWTAEMFLIFSLLRPDIFSMGDLGLQNAVTKLYKLNSKPSNKELLQISNKWSPYRSTASRILWRMLDDK